MGTLLAPSVSRTVVRLDAAAVEALVAAMRGEALRVPAPATSVERCDCNF